VCRIYGEEKESELMEVILFFAGMMIVLSFIFITADRYRMPSDAAKTILFKRFVDDAIARQKGRKVSNAQMRDSVMAINDLTGGKVYKHIYKRKK
tara:strand:- start:482 stop:766 length:285 start_codon:yes stop_codon:yes gene_type:complete